MDSKPKKPNYPRFIGMGRFVANDVTDGKNWLLSCGKKLEPLVEAASVPEDNDLSMFATIELEYSAFRLRLAVDVDCEDAEMHFAKQDPTIAEYLKSWDDDLEVPEALVKLRSELRAIKDRLSELTNEAWRIITDKARPDTIDGSASGCNPESNNMVCSVRFHLIYGHVTCAGCKRQLDFSSSNRHNHGWIQCSNCDAHLVKLATQNVGLADGLHQVKPGMISANAAYQLFIHGHTDDGSFHQSGPVTDWFKERARFYVHVEGGHVVGYSYWNDLDGTPVLRQVWVHYDHRRKGIGRKLVDVEAKGAKEFGVESPNEYGRALIKAAGYDDSAFLVQGM